MTIEELKQSFIFNALLTSKGLFHTNIWAWLLENDPSLAAHLFGFNAHYLDSISIKRETKSVDILIEEIEHRYLIKDDLKSLISREQLESWGDQNFRDGIFIEGVITGIEAPIFELPNRWRFVSYQEIAVQLEQKLNENRFDRFYSENYHYLLEYSKVLESIYTHIHDLLFTNIDLYSLSYGRLDEIHFDDVYKSLKANQFLSVYNEMNNHLHLPENYILKNNISLNRHEMAISFEIVSLNMNFKIGIQLHKNQYILFVHKNFEYESDSIFNEFARLGWFDRHFNPITNPEIFGHPTRMKPLYNNQFNRTKSERENYKYVFQYYNIDNLPYNELIHRINRDLSRASEILVHIEQ